MSVTLPKPLAVSVSVMLECWTDDSRRPASAPWAIR